MKLYLVFSILMAFTQPINTDRKLPDLSSLSKLTDADTSLNTEKTSQPVMLPDSPQNWSQPVMGPDPHHNWSLRSKVFYKALKNLGIFKMQDILLEKLPKEKISLLKKAKNQIIVVKDRQDTEEVTQKRSRSDLHDFCKEYYDRKIVLAHEREQLAYLIKSVRCEGVCYSKFFQLEIGKCVLKEKMMIVYVMENGEFIPKTVNAGCACECWHYKMYT